jgi:hypothetical protein
MHYTYFKLFLLAAYGHHVLHNLLKKTHVGASHMSDNRQMSVAMQQLVDLIFMATNSTLLRYNTVTLLLAEFSVGRSIRNSPLLCNG